MAVKIKLKRLGKIRAPYYRVVIADARAKRDGRAIEEIGKYHPKQEPSLIEINSERVQYWLSVGAQPTDPVRNLLQITGDWQRFRGEEGTEGTLKSPAPKKDKKEAFAAVLKETHGDAAGAATTSKTRGRKADAKADKPDTRAAKGARGSRGDTAGPADGTSAAEAGADEPKAAGARKRTGRAQAKEAKPTAKGGRDATADAGAASTEATAAGDSGGGA